MFEGVVSCCAAVKVHAAQRLQALAAAAAGRGSKFMHVP
jgi:hypothetical protein